MLNLLSNRRKSLNHETIQLETALMATPSILPGIEAYISADGTGHIRREVRERGLFDRMRNREIAKRRCFFNLDAFGSIYWKHIDGRNTLSQIARKMAGEFDWDLSATENSVFEFTKTLMSRGLIDLRIKARSRYSDLRYGR